MFAPLAKLHKARFFMDTNIGNRTIGLQTYHTLRYLHTDAVIKNRTYKAKSADDIKKIIWERIRPTIKDETQRYSFKKGIRLCDFNAIFDWVCTQRGYYIAFDDLIIEMLRSVRQPPSNAVAVT